MESKKSALLTGLRERPQARRGRFCRLHAMTLLLTTLAVAPQVARADEETATVTRLVRRALARAGLEPARLGTRAQAAPLLPSLAVETAVAPPAWGVGVVLCWPLGEPA